MGYSEADILEQDASQFGKIMTTEASQVRDRGSAKMRLGVPVLRRKRSNVPGRHSHINGC